MNMDSSRIAELEMRVKALEADTAAAERRIAGLTRAVELLIEHVDALRSAGQ